MREWRRPLTTAYTWPADTTSRGSHDDLWAPEKLSEQLRALQSVNGPAVCYTDIKLIDGEGKVFDEKEAPLPADRHAILRDVLRGEPILFAAYSIVCDMRCFEQVGLYDLKKRYTQDADMLLRLARTFPFVRVPEKLMFVREHVMRDSSARPSRQKPSRSIERGSIR